MTIRIQGLGHVLLVVRDVAQAREFYCGVLGLEVLEEDPAHGGVFLAAGSGSHVLDILGLPEPYRTEAVELAGKPRLGVQHFAFRVETEATLRDAFFDLEDRGIKVQNAVDHVNQLSIYIQDPDGNVVELYWERPDQRDIWATGRGDDDHPLRFQRDPAPG